LSSHLSAGPFLKVSQEPGSEICRKKTLKGGNIETSKGATEPVGDSNSANHERKRKSPCNFRSLHITCQGAYTLGGIDGSTEKGTKKPERRDLRELPLDDLRSALLGAESTSKKGEATCLFVRLVRSTISSILARKSFGRGGLSWEKNASRQDNQEVGKIEIPTASSCKRHEPSGRERFV